tara:strand:- start:404 stop:1195 length:792 start_codon:yes stop_codon:yes gene_type:complete
MRYKMFLFDKECVLDLKTDRIIFPFTKEYLDYQDWVTNNPNEFTRLVTKGKDDASWQGLLEEVIEKEDGTFVKKLYHDDYTLWVESESRLLPNQDYQTHGVQKTYHKDGWVKTEENFRSGLKHGRFYSYDVKGNITGIGKYSRDKKIGVWKYYFPLSKITQVEEVYYDNGKMKNKKEYTKQSKLLRNFNYNENGNLHGQYRDSHNNGELRARGSLKDGKMDGLWYFYYIDGTQEYEIKFDNGKAQDRLTYFGMDGQVKWEKTL